MSRKLSLLFLLGILSLAAALAQIYPFPGPGTAGPHSGGGGSTSTYIQGCVEDASAATTNCTTGSDVTAGNLLVVASKTGSQGLPVSYTITGAGCTWSQLTIIADATGEDMATNIGYCIVPTTTTGTITVTWAGGGLDSTFTDIAVAEYSGSAGWNATPLDQSVETATATSTSCPSGTTSATTNADDLVVGVAFNFNQAQTYGAVAGYTFRSASSRNTTGYYDKDVSSTGTQSITVPIASDICNGMLAAFKLN